VVGAAVLAAALWVAAGRAGCGLLAGLAFGLGLGLGAGVVADVVVGVAAAVLVVEDELEEEDAPHPAAASATRHDNSIVRKPGRVMLCSFSGSPEVTRHQRRLRARLLPGVGRRRLCSRACTSVS
jgi:hypothetical protein